MRLPDCHNIRHFYDIFFIVNPVKCSPRSPDMEPIKNKAPRRPLPESMIQRSGDTIHPGSIRVPIALVAP